MSNKYTKQQLEQDDSLWPEGATHYAPETSKRFAAFFKVGGPELLFKLAGKDEPWAVCNSHLPVDAICRPTKSAWVPEVESKTIYWVAEVDQYGTPWNFDGPHETYEAAENSIPLLKGLSKKDAKLIVTTMQFEPVKSERDLFVEAVTGEYKAHVWTIKEIAEALYDSGKFKLVENEE